MITCVPVYTEEVHLKKITKKYMYMVRTVFAKREININKYKLTVMRQWFKKLYN